MSARLLVALIKGYQAAFAWRPSPCRYSPTCSHYGIAAIERHGARKGGWLTLRRIGRCHPWGGMGVDPVPD